MNSTARIGIVAVVVLAGAAVAWSWGVGLQPAPAAPAATRDSADANTGDAAAAPVPEIEQRQVVATDDPALSPLAHPFVFSLRVEVRDRDGLPVERAQVWLAPPGCALTKAPVRSGADGVVLVEWFGKQPEMEMALRVGGQAMLHRLSLRAGTPGHVVVEGRAGGRGLVLSMDGKAPSGQMRFSFTAEGGRSGDGIALALESLLTERAATGNLAMQAGLHPFAVFADALVPEVQAKATEAVRVLGNVPVLTNFFNVQGGQLEFTIDASGAPPDKTAPTVLEGTVYDDQGRPAKKVTVCWGEAVDLPAARTTTDEHGKFRFDNLTEGYKELRAGGRDDGLCHMRVHVAGGQTTRWDAHLHRETSFRGRAIDTKGQPLKGWTIEVAGAQQPWFDAARVRDDGSFELPNQPGPMCTLLLRHPKDDVKLPVAVIGSVLPDSGDLLVKFDPAAVQGGLQIEPVVPDGLQVQAEARVWQEETGRGAPMDKAEKTPVYSLGGLPAGWYRIEIGATSLGWADAGRHWVDGKTKANLGKFLLPRAGSVRIVHPEGSVPSGEAFEQQICLRQPACDLRAEDSTAAKQGPVALPTGDYWLLWKDVGGKLHLRAFAVEAGKETLVDTALPAALPADAGAARR